jgi:hypothetical protein
MSGPIPALVLLVPVVAWLAQAQRIASRLEQRHPEVFRRLGEPHLLKNNTPSKNFALVEFILGKGCEELGDDQLTALCKVGRVLFFVVIAFVAAGGGTLLLLALQSTAPHHR